MLKTVLFNLIILILNCNLSDAILRSEKTKEQKHNLFSARQMGRSIAQCFGNNEIMNCLENEMFDSLDKAIQNNDTWQLSDFLVIEKNSKMSLKDFEKLQNLSMTQQQQHGRQQRSLSDSLALKMLQLARTRSIKLQLPSSLNALFNKHGGISSAIDEFITTTTTTSAADSSDVAANPLATAAQQEEGRKKKDKDKNMAMMGGMAMLAMVAQMFLGKVILIAGAAFVMAKIALLISVLGSLKKGSSGSSGSTEHVIVTGGGGGGGGSSGGHSHEHSSGWHRSMPYHYNKLEIVAADEYKHTEPSTYFEISENDEFKRRQQTIN